MKSVVVSSVDPEDDMLHTLLFWFAIIAIVFLIGRYSDTLCNSARRFISGTSAEDEEIRALKLSGGNENSDMNDSLGEKLRDFAHASKETIKNTFSRGRETFNAATESMQGANEGRQRRGGPPQGEGALNLLNDVDDDGIGRLDGDEEKPFQSFASQM